MGNAVWLVMAVPAWFASALVATENGQWRTPLIGVPILGMTALAAGVVFGLLKRQARLLYFLLPALLSEVLVAVAGFMRGKVHHPGPATYAFLALQLVICAYLIFRLKGARVPAAALSGFVMSYAWFAAFVASMAFTDSWI